MFISETGTEDDDRPGWLAYIAEEVRAAIRAGVDRARNLSVPDPESSRLG